MVRALRWWGVGLFLVTGCVDVPIPPEGAPCRLPARVTCMGPLAFRCECDVPNADGSCSTHDGTWARDPACTCYDGLTASCTEFGGAGGG